VVSSKDPRTAQADYRFPYSSLHSRCIILIFRPAPFYFDLVLCSLAIVFATRKLARRSTCVSLKRYGDVAAHTATPSRAGAASATRNHSQQLIACTQYTAHQFSFTREQDVFVRDFKAFFPGAIELPPRPSPLFFLSVARHKSGLSQRGPLASSL
jgi:hypothetical protein